MELPGMSITFDWVRPQVEFGGNMHRVSVATVMHGCVSVCLFVLLWDRYE